MAKKKVKKYNSGGGLPDPIAKTVDLPEVKVEAKRKRKRKYGLDKIDTELDNFNKSLSLLGFTDKQYDPISNTWEESSEDWKKVQEIGSVLSLPIGSIGTKDKLIKQLGKFFPGGEGLKEFAKSLKGFKSKLVPHL